MVEFTWDEAKRLANIEKHGIDFKHALVAFQDRNGFEYRSPQEHGEQRCILIGKMQGVLIAVIFTLRGETIRIISVRRAWKKEVALWHGNTS